MKNALEIMKHCPECGALILMCENGVWLDTESQPVVDPAEGAPLMQIAQLGGMLVAILDQTHPRGHAWHAHQPPEEEPNGEDPGNPDPGGRPGTDRRRRRETPIS